MLVNENRIYKRSVSILLMVALIISGLFLYPKESQAITVEQTVTKYHLDIGAQQVWGMGDTLETAVWDDGRKKGSAIPVSVSLEFPQEVKNVKAYPYSEDIFRWDKQEYSFNSNAYLNNEVDYRNNYLRNVSSNIANIKVFTNGKNVNLAYSAMLSSTIDFDLKHELNSGSLDKILELMGGEAVVRSKFPEVYKKLIDGANGQLGGNIYGFMYFTPVIIEYDVVEMMEIGDLEAKLSLPVSATMGEEYGLADQSVLSNNLTVSKAILEEKIEGKYAEICTWSGTKRKGENTGGSTKDKSDVMGEKTYRLTVNTIEGQSDTDERTIQITDGTKIKGQATLILPEYTYEGHPVPTEDVSTFKVEDVHYTAKRAYEEGVASNDFVTVPYSAGTVSKSSRNPTEAIAVFPRRGNYSVRLNVELRNGGLLSDIKPIQVRKTPYILDSLGGFQKQNRKQILTASIATYPGKPIIDYYIKVRNMKSGEEIYLTKNDPQNNTAVIKTRTLKKRGDQYWTNFELEFLTKIEGEFRYTIYAIDSKGDSDIKQKEFIVRPDLPPVPKITIDETFLRNKGTNIAEIISEDASTTDGDQLKRTWTLDDIHIEDISGFEDKSFGSRQKVKFEKIGVGKLGLKLHVKDIWNEPTLEEYILPEDYLAAMTEADSEVINIAPTVRLEPVISKEVDMIILAGKTSLPAISQRLNSFKAAFIEKNMDPNFSLVGVTEPDEGPYRKVATWEWDTTVNCRMCQNNSGQIDTDFAYRVTSPGKVVSGYQQICVDTGPHVVEALCPGDEKCRCGINPDTGIKTSVGSQHVAWSYPVNESTNFGICFDNMEKNIYIPLRDKGTTILLNRNNGAYITELKIAIPGTPYVSELNDNMYFIGSSIQKYDPNKNVLSTITNQVGGAYKMQEGKLRFIGKKSGGSVAGGGKGHYIGDFDMKTEKISEKAIPNLEGYNGGVAGYDFDTNGMALLAQSGKLWVADTKTQKVKEISGLGVGTHMNSTGFVKDETGKAKYIYHSYNTIDYKENGYFYFMLFDFAGNNIQQVASFSGRFTGYNWNGISYAKVHSRENKIYILQGANWQNFDMYTRSVRGFGLTIDINTMRVNAGYESWGWDLAEESGEYNESLMKTFYKYDGWYNQTDRIKLFRNSITAEEAAINAIMKKAYVTDETEAKVIAIYENEQMEALSQNPTFKRFLLENKISVISEAEITPIKLAENVLELSKEAKNALRVKGDELNSISIYKDFLWEPNTEYLYRYGITAITGTAVDVFKPVFSKHSTQNGERKFKSLVTENMSGHGATGVGSRYWGTGYGFSVSYNMEKDGFVEFIYYTEGYMYQPNETYTITHNGKVLDYKNREGGISTEKMSIFLPKGENVLNFSGSVERQDKATIIMRDVKVYYLHDDYEIFQSSGAKVSGGKAVTIENRFRASKEIVYEKKSEKQSISRESFVGNQVTSPYVSFTQSSTKRCLWGFSEGSQSAGKGSTYYDNAEGYFNVSAPADKILVVDFRESVNAPVRNTPVYGGGKMLSPNTVIIKPGATFSRYYQLGRGCDGPYGSVSVSNIKIAELDPAKYNADRVFLDGYPMSVYLTKETEPYSVLKFLESDCSIDTYYNINGGFVEGDPAPNLGTLNFNTKDVGMKNFEAYLSDFRLYRIVSGKEQLVFQNNFNDESCLDESGWQVQREGNAIVEIVKAAPMKKEPEEAPLIYKKGQLVKYNLFYEDYENDPSKKQYWRYTHTPFNDGPHKEAAVILDEDGIKVNEKELILNKPIDRFYIDGKYTVEHWQEDNTARSDTPKGADGFPIGNPDYDKSSNVESLTFYVEGGASAPWITSIKTAPRTVKEGNIFKMEIGVDDSEKEELSLTTEVYRNKKMIYTHKQKNIQALDIGNGIKGNYPLTITENVTNTAGGSNCKALAGNYEVVCTVRDKTGTGIGSYKFTVISEGKITGYVNHTDKWDKNRKKYNVKRPVVGDEETPRGRNVFWSGEKFMLSADLAGNPTQVTCQIQSYPSYKASMKSTGKKNSRGEIIYEGSLWDKSMINKWGRKGPQPLTFRFTATYEGGIVKTHDAIIVVDSKSDYYQLHRLF